MASVLRYSAVAAFITSVTGFAIGASPSPTLPGDGANFSPAPTEAPAQELVKVKLNKRAATNYCSDWTIPGGYGNPGCLNSETCLFYSYGDQYIEGCGLTSVKYNWVTECWDYGAQTGAAPVSQIYCPATAPYCGYLAFVDGIDYTYYNYGCSTVAYAFYANPVETAASNGTTSSIASLISAATTGSASSTATSAPTLILTVTSTAEPSSSSSAAAGGSETTTSGGGGATDLPTVNPHTVKKTSTGAIAGGVVGGLAAIAIAGFLIFWFCIRKRSDHQAAAQADAAQAAQTKEASSTPAAAYQPPANNAAEISGTAKPMTAFTPADSVTPAPVVYAEKAANGNTNQSAYTESQQHNAPSPPPVYSGNFTQQQQPPPQQQQYPPQQQQPPPQQQQYPPQQQQQYPPQQQQYPPEQHPQQYPPQQHPQQYPVPAPTSVPPTLAPSPGPQYSELGSTHRGSIGLPVSPTGTSTFTQSPSLGTSELAGGVAYQQHAPHPQQQQVNELGGQNRGSYQVPPHVQEMSGASGGIARPPQQPQQGGYDMSGNPLNEEYRPHELA